MKNLLILMLLYCSVCSCQTLGEEYKVKQEYKNCNPKFDYNTKTVSVFGKIYKYEESYFELKFAVLPNGDYVCLPNDDYIDRICQNENRYKVHIGNNPWQDVGNGFKRSPAIWILRKR